jgi:TonB family protein
VTISKDYYLGVYEVTQAQYEKMMGKNPSRFQGDNLRGDSANHPVEQVSWEDAVEFCKKLSDLPEEKHAGRIYRLPTEAQWEYAARAGSTTEWSHGKDESKLGNYAWYKGNSGGKTQEVGHKLPNAFGLYDMHGNVSEWTQDCWHKNYAGAPSDGSAWTTGCTGESRVVRGGSWGSYPAEFNSVKRGTREPDSMYNGLLVGFRLVTDVQRQNALEGGDRLRELQAQSDKLRKDQLERAMKQGAGSGTVAQNGPPIAEYGAKVRDAIRPNLLLIREVSPNLTAEYLVKTDATGNIFSVKLTKSSGDTYFDDAALKAILKTDRLPPDKDGRFPSPMVIVISP